MIPEPSKVNITFESPLENQTCKYNDTIHIKGHVKYISQRHGYQLNLTDNITGEILFNVEEHTHGDYFDFEKVWIDTLLEPTDVKLQVLVVMDHDNVVASKELLFKRFP